MKLRTPALAGCLAAAAVAVLAPFPQAKQRGEAVIAAPKTEGYTVAGGRLLRNGAPIVLHGVNWFGFDTPDHVAHGLWAEPVDGLVGGMKEAGVTAVRLPVCSTTLKAVPITSAVSYEINPELTGLDSLQALDLVVRALDRAGLYVLLDYHSAECGQFEQLWYTDAHSEGMWIADLTLMADRYRDVPRFIGIDLKNEPHDAASWGDSSPSTDWNHAAERAGASVLKANPRLLVFVEGSFANSDCLGAEGTWWGGSVEPVLCHPIDPSSIPADKLVLSPHVYGPSINRQPYYSSADFPANLAGIWDTQFGAVKAAGYAVVPGEWGAAYSKKIRQDRAVLEALVRYFGDRGICDSFYWAWNPNSSDVGGLLQDDWKGLQPEKYGLLKSLWDRCPAP